MKKNIIGIILNTLSLIPILILTFALFISDKSIESENIGIIGGEERPTAIFLSSNNNVISYIYIAFVIFTFIYNIYYSINMKKD